MNLKIDIKDKKNILFIVFVTLLTICFIWCGIYLIIQPNRVRRVFTFPVENKAGQYYTEIRNVPKGKTTEDEIQLYVKELLLGPQQHDVLPLVSRKTSLISCFLRDKTLFLEIDEKALLPGRFVADNIIGLPLLEKNVFTNFDSIDTMYLYINGHIVYEDSNLKTEEAVDKFLKRNKSTTSKK